MQTATQSQDGQQALAHPGDLIASIVIKGDLSGLTQPQKVEYYNGFCNRLGLDPHSQPFKLLRLNGKEIMYCDRSGAQQLNKLHDVSHEITNRAAFPDIGVYMVVAQAALPTGRHTESIGAVSILDSKGEVIRGEAMGNAMMKAETKAKRRATLDLLGLGMLDESEASDMPGAQTVPMDAAAHVEPNPAAAPQQDPFTVSYHRAPDVESLLNQADAPAQVSMLYNANRQLVDSTPGLKSWLDDKLEGLRSKLPAMSTNQFNKLVERLAKGDTAAGLKARDTFSVDEEQKAALNDAFKSYQRHARNARRKFTHAEENELGATIEMCPTPQLLDTLHAGNALLIDRSPQLKAAYDRRKDVLTKPAD